MIDRFFSAALTFCLLIAGTLAIGSEMLGMNERSVKPRTQMVQLPKVEVTGQRLPAASAVAANEGAQRVQ